MPTDLLRIETMSEAEQAVVGLLTPAERRTALVDAARSKQRRLDTTLLREHVQRVLRGEIAVQTESADGRPWPTNGETVYHQNEQTPLEDIGRVPGHTGIHVLRRPDGALEAINGFSLRRPNEVWEPINPDR